MGGASGREEPIDRPRIGLICSDDHDVFAAVADRLERAEVGVEFYEPGRWLGADDLAHLSLLMNKKVDLASFDALSLAETIGLPTWNGYPTLLLGIRPIGYWALDRVGFRVPAVSFQKPSSNYVAKRLVDFHSQPNPVLNGEGEIFHEYVPATPIDYKFYGVDTGSGIEVRVLKTTSKLHGEKAPLELVDPDPGLAENLRTLVRMTGSQAIGVDCVEADGEFWAVDVNPAPSFRHTGMVDALTRSVLARLPVAVTGHESIETGGLRPLGDF
jgi:hypothetical protein